MLWLKKFIGINWLLMLFVATLLTYGVYAIYSAAMPHEAPFWETQLTWVYIALPVCLVLALLDYRWVRWGVIPLYFVGIVALLACRFVGKEIYGARRWIDLGFLSFQPSQIAVLGGILAVAVFLDMTRDKSDWMRILVTGVIVFPPWVLVFLQPDLGSSLVWIPIVLAMLFASGIAKRWLSVLLLLAAVAVPLSVFVLREHQIKRITTFLNPDLDPLGDGYNINQSLLAISTGGWNGKGFMNPDSLNALGFLPRTIVHNDFIFSVLGEQHGFLGGLALLVVFALFLLTVLAIASAARDDLGRLLGVGVAALIFAHIGMNIGMTISVMPITGIPLPFISYGGTFLLITMICMGLLQSVWIHRKVGAPRKSREVEIDKEDMRMKGFPL